MKTKFYLVPFLAVVLLFLYTLSWATLLEPITPHFEKRGVRKSIGKSKKKATYTLSAEIGATKRTSDAITLYVHAGLTSGANNGTSWENAYRGNGGLAEALKYANENVGVANIFVAKGKYKPKYSPEDFADSTSLGVAHIKRSFLMVKDVKIYGGFDPDNGITDLTHQRLLPISSSQGTILSGDFKNDDGLPTAGTAYTFSNYSENATHVMIAAGDVGTAVLDGVTITGGNANATADIKVHTQTIAQKRGGGMFNVAANPSIRNVYFVLNRAMQFGGGMSNVSCPEIRVINTVFSGNQAVGTYGGAVYNENTPMTLANAIFSGNVSGGLGGGLFNTGSSASSTIVNSVFSGNKAVQVGGAIANFQSGNCIITNSIVWDNQSAASIPIFSNPVTPQISYSVVEGGSSGGNSGDNPEFVSAYPSANAPFIGGNYRTKTPSLATMDKGNDEKVPDFVTTDIDGNPRIQGAKVDIGAYESEAKEIELTRIYVNANLVGGNNNGRDWENAFRGASGFAKALQYARVHSSVQDIWVAKGTYYTAHRVDTHSDADPLDPNNGFVLVDGVKVYGGFEGNEGDIRQRDWKQNETILSGDQNKSLVADDGDAYQVVLGVNVGSETVLDGFTIRGGYAAASETMVEIDGLEVSQALGAGMYNFHASPVVQNCIFYKNKSRYLGGGMANTDDSQPTLSQVVFRENEALSGGGLYNKGMEHQFSGLMFENNLAHSNGGAVYNESAFISFLSSVFVGNSADFGGGVASIFEITDNGAAGNYLGCLFAKNTATTKGGAYYYENGAGDSPAFINCTFSKDLCSAADGGNVLYFQQNTANQLPAFYNSIIEKAESGSFYAGSSPDAYLAEYVMSDYSLPTTGAFKNISLSADFWFANSSSPAGADEQYGTLDDGFRLLETSLAVNSGSNALVPAALEKDLTGQQRIQNTTVDLGAYEYSLTVTRLYVRQDLATGNNNGRSWEDAFQGKSGLGEALYYAHENPGVEEIWVAKGTYVPNRRGDTFSNANPNDRNNTFVLVEGVKVFGGFDGTEATLGQRNWGKNQTVLSGDVGTSGYLYDNCYHVVVSVRNTAATELNGLIITSGMAEGIGNMIISTKLIPQEFGGGMYLIQSSPTFKNLVVHNNSSESNGGGITNNDSAPVLTNMVFYRNLAAYFGGAIYNINGSHPVITHTTVFRNYAGAIVNDSQSGAILGNSILWANTSWESGTPVDIFDRDASGTVVKSSVTQVYGTEGVNGISHQDPKFVNPPSPSATVESWMTSADGLALLPGSPAINTGDNALVPAGLTKDITGGDRTIGANVDMGAYEFSDPCGSAVTVIYVDSANVAGGDGSSWGSAFRTFAEAIDLANKCSVIEEVRVAKGTYFQNTLINRDVSFNINRTNLKIVGGYPNGGGDRDHRKNNTILDGNIADPSLSTDNSIHIMTIVGLTGPDSVVVDGFLFQNGRTFNSGGGILINGVSVPRHRGGAIYIGNNSYDTPIVVRNSSFTKNFSEESGASIFCFETQVTIQSCRFFENESVDQAPAIYVYKSTTPILNSLFTKNVAGGQGGAITFNEATASSLINCTFFKNYTRGTTAYGGAINCFRSELSISSCLFNRNTYGGMNTDSRRDASDVDPHDNRHTLSISKSLMQVGSPYLECTDCPAPGTDPQFIDVSVPTKRGLGLLAGSKAINRGDKTKLPSLVVTDLLGADRVRGVETDLGAFEAIPLTDPLERLYVKEDQETGYNNGYGWENAFYGSNGFGRALEYARNNSSVKEIWVASGTYYTYARGDNHTSDNALDPSNSFVLVEGVKIYGGFAGGEENLEDRDWKNNVTILSGDQNKNSTADNGDAYHVVISVDNTAETVLDGFTITGGYTERFAEEGNILVAGKTVARNSGAGMYNLDSSPKVLNCIFYKNIARGPGGGMANRQASQPTLVNVTFRENRALMGGGMFNVQYEFYGTPVVHHFTGLMFDGNVAEGVTAGEGGAVHNARAFTSFDNSVFINNSAIDGGAIAATNMTNQRYGHREIYRNCLFINNSASRRAGAYFYSTEDPYGPIFVNSAFSKNICAQESGGDVFFFLYSYPVEEYPGFYNCVMEKAEGGHKFFGGSPLFVADRNLTNYTFEEYFTKRNIVVTDLGLTNSELPAGPDGEYGSADDGLIPLATSKAINGGGNEHVPKSLTEDLLGAKRLQGPFVDIGAYEFNEACTETSAEIATNGDLLEEVVLSDEPVYLFEPDDCRVMGIFQAVNSELQNGLISARVTVERSAPFYNSQPYVRRHFDLEPATDSEAHQGYLTLYFSDRDFENYNDRIQNKGFKKLPEPGSDDFVNNLLIWQWHGTSDTRTPGSYTKNGTLSTGKFIKPNSSDIVYNEELRRWEIKFHFTGFSGFFVTTPEEGALPVTLTSFAVSAQSQEQHRTAALLTWSTAEETNSKNFEIQSSANGKDWLVIGLVEAQEKSSIETRYSFTDTAPGHGTNFYRLRMIDRDGTFAYSSIRSLRVPFDIVIYPNPVNDWLHIDIESRQAVQQVTIFDVVGREVGRHPYVPEVPLSVKDLSPGIYFVELLGENGYLERRKIVVARP